MKQEALILSIHLHLSTDHRANTHRKEGWL